MHFFVESPRSWPEQPSHVRGGPANVWDIPQGSLESLANSLGKVSFEDLGHFGRQGWISEVLQPVSLDLRLGLVAETRNLPLEEQIAYVAESGCSILNPYEIAYLAEEWRRRSRRRLFEGFVRTRTEMSGPPSHLSRVPTTVVLFYDAHGNLRFGQENQGCARSDLGVLAGLRRSPL